MRGTAALLHAKSKIHPVKAGSWGVMNTSIPKKQRSNESSEGRMKEEKADPIVAFSRPPPIPPVLGPLVFVSLLNTRSSKDADDG